jgi:hypothetical protein
MKHLKTHESFKNINGIFEPHDNKLPKYEVDDYVSVYYYIVGSIALIKITDFGFETMLNVNGHRSKNYFYKGSLSNGAKISVYGSEIIRKMNDEEIKKFELESNVSKYNI